MRNARRPSTWELSPTPRADAVDRPEIQRRTLVRDLVVLGVATLVIRLINLDHTVFIDELNHIIAASSLLAEGNLEMPGGSEYTRARFLTYLVAFSYLIFGESIVSARVPSVVAGTAMVLVLFAWVWRVAGRSSAWIAALLFALTPQAIYHAQIARMYSFQGLFVLLTAWASYEIVVKNALSRRATLLLGSAAVLGALLSLAAQISSIVGLSAIAGWIAFVGGASPRGRRFLSQVSTKWLLGGVLTVAIIGALVVQSGFPSRALVLFRHSDLWASGPEETVMYYHYSFWEHFPLFWSIFPILALLALARRFYAASLWVATFSLIFLVHSFAAWKADRYVFYSLPFFFALCGVALGPAIQWIFREIQTLARPLQPSMATRVIATIVLIFAVAFALRNNPGYRYALDMVTGDDTSWTHERPYRGEANWRALAEVVEEGLDSFEVLVGSTEPKANYFLGRSDYTLSVNDLATGHGALNEFSRSARSGGLIISRPESLAWVMDCHATGLIVIEQNRWRQFWGVTDDAADLIEVRTSRMDLPSGWRIRAYTWHRADQPKAAGQTAGCTPPDSLREAVPVIPEHGR